MLHCETPVRRRAVSSLQAQLKRRAVSNKRKKKQRDPKAVEYPRGAQTQLFSFMLKRLRNFQDLIRKHILDDLDGFYRAAGIRTDGLPEQLDIIAAIIDTEQGATFPATLTRGALGQLADNIDQHSSAALTSSLRPAIGIDVVGDVPKIREVSQIFAHNATKLIQSVETKLLSDVEDTVVRAIQQGTHVKQLRKEIQKKFDVSKNRANLIARDQVGKFYSQLTEHRQTDLGIKEYIWSTSLDERVRDTHASLEGQKFSWDNPPSVGHPGWDFQCRCEAIPVLDLDS